MNYSKGKTVDTVMLKKNTQSSDSKFLMHVKGSPCTLRIPEIENFWTGLHGNPNALLF